jgi:ligand-binding sensor domain-containing protein
VHGVGRGPGDALWAATSEGLSRYDGTAWRGFGLDEESVVACRGVARDARGLWVATAKGLRLVTDADAKAGRDGETVLPRDMRDVKLDREGRLWALSASSIALVRPRVDNR